MKLSHPALVDPIQKVQHDHKYLSIFPWSKNLVMFEIQVAAFENTS